MEVTKEEGIWIYRGLVINDKFVIKSMQLRPDYKGRPPTKEQLIETERKRFEKAMKYWDERLKQCVGKF